VLAVALAAAIGATINAVLLGRDYLERSADRA
jgi:hypothetical protein